jgi:hypothetical protein
METALTGRCIDQSVDSATRDTVQRAIQDGIQDAIAGAIREWSRCSGPWYASGPRYTPREQKQREKAWDRALDGARSTCRRRDPDAEARLTQSFARFAAEALDLGPDAIHLLTEGFLPVGTQLARWAHRFDRGLSHADITQAARNAWTACGMQPLLGAPLRLTPSILAYSLLYPYSDNYLDQRSITHADKVRFSHRFRSRLRGEAMPAADSHESSIWELVRMIEQEFPRAHYRGVFDSLLAIHAAQEQSVRQIEECGRLSPGELLNISCAKGGTSVLADAFLVRGSVTSAEFDFAFLWGVLLQLGDDLQDIHEDLDRGSDTLFTRAVRAGLPLDSLVEQLLNLSDSVAACMDALPHAPALNKNLLRMSGRSLVLMAIAQARNCFTPAFLTRMQPSSPFRFKFLAKRKQKLAGERGLFQRIFDILLSGERDIVPGISQADIGHLPTLSPLGIPGLAATRG